MSTKGTERVKSSGEVFTPKSLVREMLDRLPNAVWFDPNKTWLEPAAGDGNFLVEIKARLLQAGHDEVHILENMLFSIELIDDNHWTLQHRLGYLIGGQPNPSLNPKHFILDAKISQLTQDLNDKNPYVAIGCARDEILHHRNHVCASGLEYDMSFGRTDDEIVPVLEVLPERNLGPWPETDTPDVGEQYVVERMLGKQPQLQHTIEPVIQKTSPTKRGMVDESRILELIAGSWDPTKSAPVNRALKLSGVLEKYIREKGIKKASPELHATVKSLIESFKPS